MRKQPLKQCALDNQRYAQEALDRSRMYKFRYI